MTTPAEARRRRHAARQPHLRQEMADLLVRWRIYMRVHQADIAEVMSAWERVSETERRMWQAEALTAIYRNQVRRLRAEIADLRAAAASQGGRGPSEPGITLEMLDIIENAIFNGEEHDIQAIWNWVDRWRERLEGGEG